MIYHDKGLEELQAILNKFEENHTKRVGRNLDRENLKAFLEMRLEEKKRDYFNSVFGTLSASDIVNLLSLMEIQEKAPPKEAEIQEPVIEAQKKTRRKKAGHE